MKHMSDSSGLPLDAWYLLYDFDLFCKLYIIVPILLLENQAMKELCNSPDVTLMMSWGLNQGWFDSNAFIFFCELLRRQILHLFFFLFHTPLT